MQKMQTICFKILSLLGIAIFLVLFYYSCRYTITRFYSSDIVDNRDQWQWNLIFLLLTLAAVCLIGKISEKISRRAVHVIAIVVACGVAVAGCILSKSASFQPITDQAHIYYNVLAVLEENSSGIIEKDYYLLYPYQLGLVEIFALFLKLAGNTDVRTLEIIQAFLAGIAVYAGFRIVKELFDHVETEIVYLLMSAGFAPMYIYCMFVYGETLGICASMLGIWMFLMANRESNKTWMTVMYFALSMFSMTVACLARGALLVIWIAMMIIQVFVFLKHRKILPLVAAFLILPAIVIGGRVTVGIAERQSDYDFGDGCPKLMWIAMGLQENEGSNAGPGSYNGFNADNFIACGYNTEIAQNMAKEAIAESIADYVRNPGKMVSFFKRKTMNQWNEPTYGAFFHTYYMEEQEEWVDKLYFDEEVNGKARDYMDCYQFICYAAILGYFIMLFRKKHDEKVFLPGLIIIGEFILSMLWEAGSRYVYPYIVIALPCVAAGLVFYAECGKRALICGGLAIRKYKKKDEEKKNV